MNRGQALRGVLLVLLASSGTLAGLAPAASADDNLVICFDQDPYRNEPCEPQADLPIPDYLQTESVVVTLRTSGNPWVRVRCVEDCPDGKDRAYYAMWRGRALHFPRDFDESGPRLDGGDAPDEQVPRYNGTWEVTALLTTGEVTRRFHVWTLDVFAGQDGMVRPGELHRIAARGFRPDAPLSVRIEHLLPDGSNETVYVAPGARTDPYGRYHHAWDVPRSIAERQRLCGGAHACDRYRLVIEGGGKSTEEIVFRLRPARIEPVEVRNDAPEFPAAAERTRNISLIYRFHYPPGERVRGPAFTADDLPDSPANPERILRVHVENSTATGGWTHRGEVEMRYTSRNLWEATWTPPRDAPTNVTYRLRLPKTYDAWGSAIEEMVLGEFQLQAARLDARLVERVDVLERADHGRFVLRLAYHDGTPWTSQDNRTPLRGCFVPDRETPPPTCTGQPTLQGAYEGDGRWAFVARYPYDHPGLGTYRFLFVGDDQAQDQWGNRARSLAADPFELVEASPRIDFRTVLRGVATTVLERGHRVSLVATVTYGDGSPYNRTVAPDQSPRLEVTLTRRGPANDVVREDVLVLEETDREAGRFIGELALTRDDTDAPLGNWTFRFDVRDNVTKPNANRTSFDRRVIAAPLRLDPVREPPSVVPIDGRITYRFRLLYEDSSVVPASALGSQLEVRLHRLLADGRAGEAVSNPLLPAYDAGAGTYSVEYVVASRLFSGNYVFVVSGGDRFGNELPGDATSRPFSTYAPTKPRAVLADPAPELRRGESAAVVFDGQEGDVGADGAGEPVIRVERWEPLRRLWVVERRDVRQEESPGGDHLGVFVVTETTAIGLYRFVLEGRDAKFNLVQTPSANFTVAPTTLVRPLLVPPPARVVKGEPFTFEAEVRPGDRFSGAVVHFNGRPYGDERPTLQTQDGRLNVTWTVPFEAPVGNYSIVVSGRDLYGNNLTVRTPLVEALAAELAGRVLGQPARAVARGAPATVLFGITYPTGLFYAAEQAPTVLVHARDGQAGKAVVSRNGLTFQASWTPPQDAATEEYWFEISGQAGGGNLFPPLRTQPFRVVAGEISREPLARLAPSFTRGSEVRLEVPFKLDDAFVGFTLAYYGRAAQASDVERESREPISITEIAHGLDAEKARYVARVPTDLDTTVGVYRILMEGEDRHGNVIRAASTYFLVSPASITIQWDGFPPQDAFGEGKEIEISFFATYATGKPMTPAEGTPSVSLLLNGRPVTPAPELEHRSGRWVVRWTGPDTMPDGSYAFVVGGSDHAGNTIRVSSTIAYPLQSGTVESFSKVVPGAGPAPVLLAVALLALAFTRRQRKRV